MSPFTTLSPGIKPCHIGIDAAFIQKYQFARIHIWLFFPRLPALRLHLDTLVHWHVADSPGCPLFEHEIANRIFSQTPAFFPFVDDIVRSTGDPDCSVWSDRLRDVLFFFHDAFNNLGRLCELFCLRARVRHR